MKRQLLADRNLRVLFVGQSMNMFGNSALVVVLGIWVKDLTGSSGAAGFIYLLLAAASFLAPVSGLLIDRFPRRGLLMANDTVTGLAIALLFLVHQRRDVWLIYVVAWVYGVSAQIYRGARGGLLHSMVPDELLGEANGLFSSLNQSTRIIGPLVGAGLYAAWGGAVVTSVDIATFAFSVGSYLLLRSVPDLARQAKSGAGGQPESRQFWPELMAGVRHVMANPVIRRMILASTVGFAGAGMIDVAMFSLVAQGLHKPTAMIGVLTSVEGVGSVVTGLCIGTMMRRLGEYAVASTGFLLNGVGLAVSSTATLSGAIAGTVLLGIGLPMVLVAELTVVQRRTAAELQGRAISASDAIIDIPFASSIAVGAGVIGIVGFRPIYLGVAAGFIAVGAALLRYQKITRPEPTAAQPAQAQA